jgi:hypothetical protein
LELIRERKPCVFLRRLLLGWKVLFMGSSYLSLQNFDSISRVESMSRTMLRSPRKFPQLWKNLRKM